MEDEKQINGELMWGSIASHVNAIEEEADRLEWPVIIDMVADAFCDGEKEKNPMDLFLNLYQYTFRLLYRLKALSKPGDLNKISKTDWLIDHDKVPVYMVSDYDYKMFKWARSKKLTEYMTNQWFIVPESSLSASEKHKFDKQLEEQKNKTP